MELSLKGILRYVGIEPPQIHDVGSLLLEHSERFPSKVASYLERLASISKRLRKQMELAFYGDIDFIPTEEYSQDDASAAIQDAKFVVEVAEKLITEQICSSNKS